MFVFVFLWLKCRFHTLNFHPKHISVNKKKSCGSASPWHQPGANDTGLETPSFPYFQSPLFVIGN